MSIDNFKEIITSHTRIKRFLNNNNLYLKKRFGQNFLFDKNIIQKIIKNIPLKNKNIIEIGPGLGNLTLFYYDQIKKALLIEIDKGLFEQLHTVLRDQNRIQLIHGDFLKTDLNKYIKKNQKYIYISNLPYSIGSQILIQIMHYYSTIDQLYIMAPDIYLEHLFSKNNYFKNRLGVLLNIFFKIEKKFIVQKNSFFPVPEVHSVFLKLTPCKNVPNILTTLKILSKLFHQKRRILKKELEKYSNDNLQKYYQKRIDELSLDEIKEILLVLSL